MKKKNYFFHIFGNFYLIFSYFFRILGRFSPDFCTGDPKPIFLYFGHTPSAWPLPKPVFFCILDTLPPHGLSQNLFFFCILDTHTPWPKNLFFFVWPAQIFLSFDRGWGPRSDREPGPSLDQMPGRAADPAPEAAAPPTKPPRPSVRKFAVQNFERPKNPEDSSDFDHFLMESIGIIF